MKNQEKFFSVLESILLETGHCLTVKNWTFNPALEWSKGMGADKQRDTCPNVIVKPNLLVSTEGMEGMTNQSGGSTMHRDFKNLIWLDGILKWGLCATRHHCDSRSCFREDCLHTAKV